MRDGSVHLRDGRRLTYREFGAETGPVLIALHGTPGSRLKFSAADAPAKAVGLRIVAPDRWGYGGTDLHPAPSLEAFARDALELADRLGIGRFSLLGVSGGGPYATAIAAVRPDRVTALALAAPVGPIRGAARVELTAFHRLCFHVLPHQPRVVGAIFRAFRSLLAVDEDAGMRITMVRTAAADRQVLRHRATRLRLGRTFLEGLRPGVAGPVTDLAIFGRPWDVEPEAADVRARLWLGSADQNVPIAAAQGLARRLPRCEFVELAGEGHLWVAHNYATVVDWIVQTPG
jgi:pimeloyl-ACP methyl ester carboxylesterase